MSVMDNSAIERIANVDLTDDALSLLETYSTNDDVVFFLGRLAWQGKMTDCAPAFAKIASDPARGKYARIAAIRGAMSVGASELKNQLLETIANDPGPLDHGVLAELLDWVPTTTRGVRLMLTALEHASPFERYGVTGLDHALNDFIDRLPVMSDSVEDHPLGRLIEGLNGFLEREPFIEIGECHVAEKFAWLMPPALRAVDRLVAARSGQALSAAAIGILCNWPAVRFWRGRDFDESKSALARNVPRWRELNDQVYWASIAGARARMEGKNEQLIDDWRVFFHHPFWAFGLEDFERCLEWVSTKEGDDRAVALHLCIRLYVGADRPVAWLEALRAAVLSDAQLSTMLEGRLDPKPSPALVEMNAEQNRWKRKHEARERKKKRDRADWVRLLKANPDRVLHPIGLKPGEFGNDQYYLLVSCMSDGTSTNREDSTNWQSLIPEFGEQVARAYRDAAVAHWRAYCPALKSEGADTSSTPYSLLYAMTGLAIEAAEDSGFAERLTQDEARLAFRYITWELNGFPEWFERLYRAFPEIGSDVVSKELTWELEHSAAESPQHYILHDILYFAPWLHAEIAPLIVSWLQKKEIPNEDALRHCLGILTSGGTSPKALADLAAGKINSSTNVDQLPRWFSLWVDTDPSAAIPALEAALDALSPSDASAFAQQFAVNLVGDRHGSGVRIGAYRKARELKALYILMHRYIRSAEDIKRANMGVYSPTLRDNAQGARDRLFNMLVEVPDADAYLAIKALEAEHPETNYRRWMTLRARERATKDADEPAWTTEQVRDFARTTTSA